MVSWHKADLYKRMYCALKDGRKISMPRYYKDKIYKWYERNMIAEVMMKEMEKKKKEDMALLGNYYHTVIMQSHETATERLRLINNEKRSNKL